jgi:thiamine-phosphate pyrophosphorylase
MWPRGFYAVLNHDDDRPDLLALAERLCEALIAGGASVLQVRGKHLPRARLRELALAARRWTRAGGLPLVVNDHLDLALEVEADAVHLGQDDLDLGAARARAGDRLRIGISTHTPEQARQAAAAGADYLGFGPVFATRTKANPDAVQGLAGLSRAVALAAPVPVVAIGGIGLDDVAAVRAAGAASACVIAAVNGSTAVQAAAARVSQVFAT